MLSKGLTKDEAEERLRQFGPNELQEVSKTTFIMLLFRQVHSNFVIYLLFASMVISFVVGKPITGYTILAVILTVIVAGFVQEYRSERAIAALKGMLVPVSLVIRDGKEQEVLTTHVVPGDLVVLRNGEKVPADCLILEAKDLRVNEAVLTGESREVAKKAGKGKGYTDANVIFMGTYIVNGKCLARVLHTGMNTKFGNIASLISRTEKELPLQQKVNAISRYIAIVGIIMAVLTSALVLARSPVIDNDVIISVLILGISISVAAFPESFPMVLIATLSSGAYRMAKQNAIVNRTSIIETLGETTVICSDKTGTITKGEMTVKRIYASAAFYEVTGTGYEAQGDFLRKGRKTDIAKEHFAKALFHCAAICNDARIERDGQANEFSVRGSPTEAAVLVMAAKAGIRKEDLEYRVVQEIPFNSERKTMSVLAECGKERYVYAKGAPEYLLRHCTHMLGKGGAVRLTEKDKRRILDANNAMMRDSLRTLAFAYKMAAGTLNRSREQLEEQLVFIALTGMEDPPREEVKESIRDCESAGISVKMITGDNRETALSIAKEVGLDGAVMDGHELDRITDDELAKVISGIAIFARVKPEHKMRIIKALKANGEIVTMTGDGVNDAPALKEAHIGVAMGKNGTDVTRSVADLTLKDDNFSTLVLAISEGRTIFKNIRKFVTYQLSCNFAELTSLFLGVVLSPILGWQVPLLLAMQILFMNLVTSDLPAVGLGFNPHSKDAMQEKPRKNATLINKKSLTILVFNGTLIMLMVLLSYYWSFNIQGASADYARTVALCTLIALEIISAFVFRSFRKGVLTRSPLVNPYLFYASLASILATTAIIYTPLNAVFSTVPLDVHGLLIPLVFAFALAFVTDILKILNNRFRFVDLEHQ